MKKLVVVSLLGFASSVFGQKLPIQLVESSCKDGQARFMVANIGTSKIDSIQAHFEGGVTATMRKPLPVGGVNLTRVNCDCQGVLIGLLVFYGKTAIVFGRDEL